MSTNNNEFSWFRKKLWPYTLEETKTLLPMTAMLSLTLFIYTTIRIVKDNLILNHTIPNNSEALLGFLKSFFVLPASVLLMFYISVISKKVDKKLVFYYIVSPFLIFFTVFKFILLPNVSLLHLSLDQIEYYQSIYPAYLNFFIAILGHWVYALFYVVAECSGNTLITYVFWKFANDVLLQEQAKKYYSIFGAFSNIGLITAGVIQMYGETTDSVCTLVILALAAKICIYWYLNKFIIKEWVVTAVTTKKKVKVGFFQGLAFVAKSKYLFYLGTTVLSYGIAINLCEQTWKGMVKIWCIESGVAYTSFSGMFFIGTGVATFLIGFFLKNIVSKYGWKTASLVTPYILVSTAMVFYSLVLADKGYFGLYFVGAFSSLVLVVAGAIQNIAGKSTKYSLFDPTSQLAYKPLEDEEKTTGKAAIDIVFGRLGKAAGGVIQSGLFMILPYITGVKYTQKELVPYLAIVVLVIGVIWVYSVYMLSDLYEERTELYEAKIAAAKKEKMSSDDNK